MPSLYGHYVFNRRARSFERINLQWNICRYLVPLFLQKKKNTFTSGFCKFSRTAVTARFTGWTRVLLIFFERCDRTRCLFSLDSELFVWSGVDRDLPSVRCSGVPYRSGWSPNTLQFSVSLRFFLPRALFGNSPRLGLSWLGLAPPSQITFSRSPRIVNHSGDRPVDATSSRHPFHPSVDRLWRKRKEGFAADLPLIRLKITMFSFS